MSFFKYSSWTSELNGSRSLIHFIKTQLHFRPVWQPCSLFHISCTELITVQDLGSFKDLDPLVKPFGCIRLFLDTFSRQTPHAITNAEPMITCRVIGFVWVRADPNALKIKPPDPHWRGTDKGWRTVKIWSKSFSENRPETSWELVTKEHSVRPQETSKTSSKLNRIPHQTVQSCPHQCQHHTSLSHGTMNRASH